MLKTFKAVLNGTQLEWLDEAPPKDDRPLNVSVTILEELPSLDISRGQKMAEILEKLSIGNTLLDVDPIEWQREMRSDRFQDPPGIALL
jgi:hypothetical protein